MSQPSRHPAHRFVFVWRAEGREIEGADLVWRGWVERIPDPRQRAEQGQEAGRIGISDLDDLPRGIRSLIEEANGPAVLTRAATSDGRARR